MMIWFVFFSLAIILALFIILTTKNLIHAGFSFFMILFAISGILMLAGSPFLALSQIIIYVGGILILILFAVMLTGKIGNAAPQTDVHQLFPATFLIICTAILLYFASLDFPNTPQKMNIDTKTFAFYLFSKQIWLVELLSVFLLIALISAVVVSRRKNANPRNLLNQK